VGAKKRPRNRIYTGAGEIPPPASRGGRPDAGRSLTAAGPRSAKGGPLAALRAAHTGRSARSGGVLLLDNPIGRASTPYLVRLQRDVAASHGVQLIVTTGVKDPAAVIQFPNVVRLDNREGRTHNRRYIVAEDSESPVGEVTGIRVAHADHRWGTESSRQEQEE